jgi:hypothetical protein
VQWRLWDTSDDDLERAKCVCVSNHDAWMIEILVSGEEENGAERAII